MKCNILVFASAFLLAGSFVNAQDETTQAPPPQCSPLVAIDCNYYDVNFVWAFDNDTCFAFVNRCVFDVANCDKYLSGQPLLEETTQEECQPKCSDCRNAAPGFIELCAQSDGKVRYFNNKCEIDRIICETAEMWYLASNTVCEVSVSADITGSTDATTIEPTDLASTESPLPQCSPFLIVDCNYYFVDFVWATDNDTCYAFVNRCVFNNANCDNYLSGQPLLEETTQEECQPKCSDCRNAAPSFKAICAQSNGKVRYFNNECEIDRIICETAEMWYQASDTVCEISVSAIQSTETTEAAVTEATTTESTESDTTVATPPNCDPYVIYDCALTFDETQYVWTINPDTGNCVYFVNRCNFDNANCNRFQNGQIIYEEIDFDETICSVN